MKESEKEELKKQFRLLQPLTFYDKKQDKTIYLNHQNSYKAADKEIVFPLPNNITLCMNIANREYDIAKKKYFATIKKITNRKSKKVSVKDDEINDVFDYIESVQVSLIFIYTAVEAFSNIAIPSDYELEKVNNKKIKEIWKKENIERWTSTSEKIGEILPKIFQIENPKNEKFWSNFKKLEAIRNDIIHQKTIKNNTDVYSEYFNHFFEQSIFEIIRSGFLIIQYFCLKSDESKIYFPLGIRQDSFNPIEVDDINDIIEPIYADDED